MPINITKGPPALCRSEKEDLISLINHLNFPYERDRVSNVVHLLQKKLNVQDESLHGEEESLVTIRPVHSLLQNSTSTLSTQHIMNTVTKSLQFLGGLPTPRNLHIGVFLPPMGPNTIHHGGNKSTLNQFDINAIRHS